MTKPLNALIIEDSQSDALLLLRELRRGGFDVHHLRVDNAQDMKSALANHKWDVILSDYSMPAFDALAALKVAQEQSPDIPFIIISGTVGEDAAVAAMKAGASDFFAKGKLTRLVPAVVSMPRSLRIRSLMSTMPFSSKSMPLMVERPLALGPRFALISGSMGLRN